MARVAEVMKGLAGIGRLINAKAVVNAALPKNLRIGGVIQNSRRPVYDAIRTCSLSELSPSRAAIRGLPEAAFGNAGDDSVLTRND